MIVWIFWLEFWAALWRRPSAEIYRLDDYRPPNGRRAA